MAALGNRTATIAESAIRLTDDETAFASDSLSPSLFGVPVCALQTAKLLLNCFQRHLILGGRKFIEHS